MSRILITGGSGLLAVNWACCLRRFHEIVLACHNKHVDLTGTRSLTFGLESVDKLARCLDDIAPDIVVHAASLTDVNLCEREPVLADHVNARLAENVALACAKSGRKLIHISTDHLFGGNKPFHTESDIPAPLNAYATSKLRGEERMVVANPGALIVRTNFFGWGHRFRKSFSDWIICSLRAGRTINAYEDVFFTPILADSLAQLVFALIAQDAQGVFNVCGDERLSKFEFAVQLATCFGLPLELVQRAKMADATMAVSRPLDMSLDNTKLRLKLGKGAGNAMKQLVELAKQEREGRPAELQNAVRE